MIRNSGLRALKIRTDTGGCVVFISTIPNMLSRKTVENYSELFEQSYLIRTVPVTSNSPERKIVQARKIYFPDNGIEQNFAVCRYTNNLFEGFLGGGFIQ